MNSDSDRLRAALVGYQQKHAEVMGRIRNIERLLFGSHTRSTTSARARADEPTPATRRPTAKKLIAAAQKKLWAGFHKLKAKPATKTATNKAARLKDQEGLSPGTQSAV